MALTGGHRALRAGGDAPGAGGEASPAGGAVVRAGHGEVPDRPRGGFGAAAVAAELLKIFTVRSSYWTLLVTVALSVGLGYLLGLSFGHSLPDMDPDMKADFDPLFVGFYSLALSQLALVVYAVLLVGGEYGSGTIRASLAAIPRRGVFYAGKLAATALTVAAVAVLTVPATFLAGQAGLGAFGVGPSADGAPTALVGAMLYLILMSLFATGVATMVRSSAISLGVLLPLLFLGSQGIGNVPRLKAATQYLPDQAGMVIMHLTGPTGDPVFGRDYGPWTGLGIMALWTVAALVGGYLVLRNRDA